MKALAAALLLAVAAANATEEPADVARGRAVFTRVCAPCHGTGPGLDGSKMLPGSERLAAKYQGAKPPFLEERSDLDAAQLRFFVRHGTGAMPMFRKTEITDADIDAVAAYIKANSHSEKAGG